MAIVEIHPEPIHGPWTAGFVLDRHVIKSVPIGYLGEHMQFDTTRSALGELVYQFKFKSGRIDDIGDTAVQFVLATWPDIDCIVAAPSSVTGSAHSALAVAGALAAALSIPRVVDAVIKNKTQAMKNVPPPDRAAILAQAIQPGPGSVAGRRVLLVDDLWQTGATMRRVAEVITGMGATEIRALAMTRTK